MAGGQARLAAGMNQPRREFFVANADMDGAAEHVHLAGGYVTNVHHHWLGFPGAWLGFPGARSARGTGWPALAAPWSTDRRESSDLSRSARAGTDAVSSIRDMTIPSVVTMSSPSNPLRAGCLPCRSAQENLGLRLRGYYAQQRSRSSIPLLSSANPILSTRYEICVTSG